MANTKPNSEQLELLKKLENSYLIELKDIEGKLSSVRNLMGEGQDINREHSSSNAIAEIFDTANGIDLSEITNKMEPTPFVRYLFEQNPNVLFTKETIMEQVKLLKENGFLQSESAKLDMLVANIISKNVGKFIEKRQDKFRNTTYIYKKG
jgi:DNA mismatch repair ATPase MutS